MTRYISDLHFGHRNIIRYDNRPFSSVDEMDEAMTELWNETVSPKDTTYILGDICWNTNYEAWKAALSRLNGTKFVVKGNHDRHDYLNRLMRDGVIKDWEHQMVVDDGSRKVVLNHSPMPVFVNMHDPRYNHLYGHVHISYDYQITLSVRKTIEELYMHEVRMYNVGCMVPGMRYMPRTLDEIVEIDRSVTRVSDIEFAKRKSGHSADSEKITGP